MSSREDQGRHVDRYGVDNPAARLSGLLRQAEECARRLGGRARARDVWAQVFGLEASDGRRLLQRLREVYRLPEDIRMAVESSNVANPAHALRGLEAVEHILVSNALEATWRDYIIGVDDAVLVSLEGCANLLATTSPAPLAPDLALLHRVRDQAATIRGEVAAAVDLPPEVRSFLVNSLRAVEQAIDEYQIRGTAGFKEAVERIAGTLVLAPNLGSSVRRSSIGKKVLAFFAGAALVLDVGIKSVDLVEKASQLPPWEVEPDATLVHELEDRGYVVRKALPPGGGSDPALPPPVVREEP